LGPGVGFFPPPEFIFFFDFPGSKLYCLYKIFVLSISVLLYTLSSKVLCSSLRIVTGFFLVVFTHTHCLSVVYFFFFLFSHNRLFLFFCFLFFQTPSVAPLRGRPPLLEVSFCSPPPPSPHPSFFKWMGLYFLNPAFSPPGGPSRF